MPSRETDALDELEELGRSMLSLGMQASARIVRRGADEIRRLRLERGRIRHEADDMATRTLFGD